MANIKPTVELDFDTIKQDIIRHFKLDPTFSDYNFEGSALNAIIDVLAYNTHTNAYYANMLHNESFIDTAQKRSSVVSIAKELGYVPASVTCSTAYADVIITTINLESAISEEFAILRQGTSFTTSNENGNHIFVVGNDASGVVSGTTVTYDNVKLVSGEVVSNTFTVDTTRNIRSIFTIPNKNVDMSTLEVFVKTGPTSQDRVKYYQATNSFELHALSTVFFAQESYDGFYQIYFGSDIIGKQPINGNIIEVSYVVANTSNLVNGCSSFILDSTPQNALSVSVSTTQPAFGGKVQESIDSIRNNALKNNTTKQRAVTANDYSIILKNKFPNVVKNCVVWGGEDHIPKIYGKVFVSIQPATGLTITDQTKQDIMTTLRNFSMLTIGPTIIDPEYLSVEFNTRVKFNRYLTTNDQTQINVLVKNKIKSFMGDLNTFDTAYYQSTLISQLADLDPGIVSINIRKKAGFNINPVVGVATRYEKTISNVIVEGSVFSSSFDCYISSLIKRNCSIKEYGLSDQYGDKSLGIFSNTTNELLGLIGKVNIFSGKFTFTVNIYQYLSGRYSLLIRCELVNDDIVTKNNQILVIDSSVDYSVPSTDNYVIVENYGS